MSDQSENQEGRRVTLPEFTLGHNEQPGVQANGPSEADCLRAALGWIPLSLRQAIERRDLAACRHWATRGVMQIEELQEEVRTYRTLWEAEKKLREIRGKHGT